MSQEQQNGISFEQVQQMIGKISFNYEMQIGQLETALKEAYQKIEVLEKDSTQDK